MTPSPSPVAAVLAELETLLAKATPGPWSVLTSRDVYSAIVGQKRGAVAMDLEDDADAALIVAAVNALPRLLAAIRAVDELAGEYERQAAGYRAAYLSTPSRDVISASMYSKASNMATDIAFALRSALAAVDVTETAE